MCVRRNATVKVFLTQNRFIGCHGHWFGYRANSLPFSLPPLLSPSSSIISTPSPSSSPSLWAKLHPTLDPLSLEGIIETKDNITEENEICSAKKGCVLGERVCVNAEREFESESLVMRAVAFLDGLFGVREGGEIE